LRADDTAAWRRTSPLAALFYLGRIWQLIARNAVQSLAPLVAFVVAFEGNPVAKAIFGVTVFVLVTIVMAVARYWAFRYCITPQAILIRDGVFHKKQLDVRFERIQGVNTTRGVLDRLFGLVNVSFDTAGSSGQEGHLPAVHELLAAELRERIRQTPKTAVAAEGEMAPPSARTLLRLGPGDMVRIGVSSGRVFLVLAVLGPLSELLDLELHKRLEETVVLEALGAAEGAGLPGPALWFAVAAAVILLLLAGAVVAAFLRYHRFELKADETVLRSTGGLVTRHEHSVDRKKIQSLVLTQNVLLRVFCRFRLRMRQAASGPGSGAQAFVVPLCAKDDLPVLEREVFENEFQDRTLDPRADVFERVSPVYLRSRIALYGIAPALAGTLLLLPTAGAASLAGLLLIPLAAAIAWQTYRRLGVLVTADGLVLRSGFLGYRMSAHLHRKVQKVAIAQSPIQRRRKLATLHIYLAAGAVRIPFIDIASAGRLRDYILYRVESSRRAWH
jgi:putative membrane protein